MSHLFVAFAFCGMVSGHVFLYDPPQRSSLWRHKGMNKTGLVVRNNDDMGLNCGGMWNQYDVNGGKCGVCGDPYDSSPHPDYPHQYPGKYARGIIAGCYKTGSRTMEADVWVTAHHMGYFEFRLCENNDYTKPVTQSCLDKHLLTIETPAGESVGTKYYPDKSKSGETDKIRLVLPVRIQCTQCVLQFLYNAGNSWGCSDDDNCGVGHGNQEQFWNCADIAIVPNCEGVVGSVAPIDTTREEQHLAHRGTAAVDTSKTQQHLPHRGTDIVDTVSTQQHLDHRGRDIVSLSHLLFQAQRVAAAPAVRMEPLEVSGSRRSLTSQPGTEAHEGPGKHAAPAGSHDQGRQTSLHTHGNHEGNEIIIPNRVRGDKAQEDGENESHTSKASDAAESSRPRSRSNQRSRATSRARSEIEDEDVHNHRVDVPVSLNSNAVSAVGSNKSNCHGTGAWDGDSDMDHWCQINCARGFCPKTTCLCDNA